MTKPTTATIEALEASVKALMVGSRQVTLSVYRQLDPIAAADITPFGRVRDSKDTKPQTIYVVGSDDAGNLVRACTSKPSRSDLSVWTHEMIMGRKCSVKHKRDIDGVYSWQAPFEMDGVTVIAQWDERIYCDHPDHNDGHCVDWHWPSDEVRDEMFDGARLAISQYQERSNRFEYWKTLPLIVLAGLR